MFAYWPYETRLRSLIATVLRKTHLLTYFKSVKFLVGDGIAVEVNLAPVRS